MSETREDYWERYSGKREVIGHALFDHDPYDQFAWVQSWRFALCDYITFDLGENVPDFRSGLYGPDIDSYAYSQLVADDIDSESAWYALRVFDRYREWLRIAGKDY